MLMPYWWLEDFSSLRSL